MKLCFLEGDMSRRGGTERMTALLANALAAHGEVWVIGLSQAEDAVFFPLSETVQYRVLAEARGKRGILRQIREIHRFIKAERIDRVINVDVGMGFYGVLAARGTGAKVITWEHGNFFNNWGSRTFPYLRRFAARHSDAVVVLTRQDRENYKTHLPRCAPVYVIPNPADTHSFAYHADARTLLSAGLLLPVKGYDRAVELAKRLLPSRPEWRWVICGEGPERENLERAIEAAGLTGRVLLPGTVRDMDRQYQDAALFVMTSHMEGLPMVLLEAKSWGLPLVSFDIETGPRDIISHGVNGCLVRPDDLEKMVETLADLMDSEPLRQQYSAQSQVGMDAFAWDRILEAWHELLERI